MNQCRYREQAKTLNSRRSVGNSTAATYRLAPDSPPNHAMNLLSRSVFFQEQGDLLGATTGAQREGA